MGIERNIVIGSVAVTGGLAIYARPRHNTELPTDPEQIKAYAVSHCDSKLARVYQGIPVPQKTYDGCLNATINELSSPINRAINEYSGDFLGTVLIGAGLIIAALPLIVRGRARFGLG